MSILNNFKNIDPQELRKEVEQHLQWAYAHNHISMEELEKRLDTLNRTDDKTEILSLVEDLPPTEEASSAHSGSTAPDESFFTVLGSNTRKGEWDVPRHLEVTALLGSQLLDFRQARFYDGTTVIKAVALLGSVDMKFPPGVRVTSKGVPFLGSIDNRVQSVSKGPLIHIEGVALLGSVSARTKK